VIKKGHEIWTLINNKIWIFLSMYNVRNAYYSLAHFFLITLIIITWIGFWLIFPCKQESTTIQLSINYLKHEQECFIRYKTRSAARVFYIW
jgi:hypothetical protein